MNTQTSDDKREVSPNISVDCSLIGFDGANLRVLLVRQIGASEIADESMYKLPGSLIYADEDLDDAAKRVLYELTGLKSVPMVQFRAFGSKDRTRNPRDVRWLERFHSLPNQIDRIVTVAYLALLKIDRKYTRLSHKYEACWVPVKDVKELAFDHNQILEASLAYIRQYVDMSPAVLFDLLPRKFTAAQLRRVYEIVYDRVFDVRNFHKRISMMKYVIPLDEKEQGVSHRAARFYRFDRVIYNQMRN